MLKPNEIVEVLGMALLGGLVLFVIYSFAWFIFAHILWIAGIAIGLAIVGVHFLSQEKMPASR